MTAQMLDGNAPPPEGDQGRADRARVGQAARARASRPGSAPCWSATTRARGGTSTASTRTAPRSASSRSASDLPATATQEEILAAVAGSTTNPACTGYIVQLPLPKGLDENAVLGAIDPAKDADGLHPTNLGWLVLGKPAPLPCTPHGIVELLRRHGVEIARRRRRRRRPWHHRRPPARPAADPPLGERHRDAVPHRHP